MCMHNIVHPEYSKYYAYYSSTRVLLVAYDKADFTGVC